MRVALTLFMLTGLAAWPNAMSQLGAVIAGGLTTDGPSRAILRGLIEQMITGLSHPS